MAQIFEGADGSLAVEDDGTITLTFGGGLAHPDKTRYSPARIPRSEVVGAEVVPARGLSLAYLRLHTRTPSPDRRGPRFDPHTLQLLRNQIGAIAPLADWLTGRTAALGPATSRLPNGRREDVRNARDSMVTKLGSRRELRHLEGHLLPGETVEHTCGGRYAGRIGLVVLTDQRLLFVFHGIMRRQTEDLALSKITSAQLKTGLVMSKLEVTASGVRTVIDHMQKLDAEPLAARLRQRLSQPETIGRAHAYPPPQMPPPPPSAQWASPPVQQAAPLDVMEQLTRLADLRDRGVLTDEEFAEQKARLLRG